MDERDIGPQERARCREKICRRLVAERKRIGVQLGFDLIPAPAWDILLDLYLAERAGHGVQIWSLCIAANVPTSTAHRKISDMVERGLLTRSMDGGRVMIRLTADTALKLEALFDDLAQALSAEYRDPVPCRCSITQT